MDTKAIQKKFLQLFPKKRIGQGGLSVAKSWQIAVMTSFCLGIVLCLVGAYEFLKKGTQEGGEGQQTETLRKPLDVERIEAVVATYRKQKEIFTSMRSTPPEIPKINELVRTVVETEPVVEESEPVEEEVPMVQS